MKKRIYLTPDVEIMSFEGDKSLCDGAMPSFQSISNALNGEKPNSMSAPKRNVF